MTDAGIVFTILGLTILFFASEKLALDLVGVLALIALYFTGILSTEEIFSGFSDPIVVTLAALFIIGGALFRTGVAATIGDWLNSKGGSDLRGLVPLIMGTSALLSAFMSSTGTAAILIPAVAGLAKRTGLSPSKLLMPLSCGCLIGGMLTLVGTAPNLVVQEALVKGGHRPFNFLSFAPMGLVVLLVAMLYMTFLGQRLLPQESEDRSGASPLLTKELAESYGLPHQLYRVRLLESSKLVGSTLSESPLRSHYHLNLLGVQHRGERSPGVMVTRDFVFQKGEILHLHGEESQVDKLVADQGLERLPQLEDYASIMGGQSVAELVLTPRSRLIGQTVKDIQFFGRYNVNLVAVKRLGKLLRERAEAKLKFGDTLLVAGEKEALHQLWDERETFVIAGMSLQNMESGLRRERAWIALALAILMLVLMSFKLLPSVMAVVLVAAAAILLGCLTTEEAYRSVSWSSLVLIAAMLPVAKALEKTGGVEMMANLLIEVAADWGPQAILAGLFFLTALFSQFISNTATTVILTPVALEAASLSQLSPHAFLMAVAVAASAAFVTPVASPVNLLVLTPGKYQFSDFVKVGLPLQLLILVVSVALLPVFFPLR